MRYFDINTLIKKKKKGVQPFKKIYNFIKFWAFTMGDKAFFPRGRHFCCEGLA